MRFGKFAVVGLGLDIFDWLLIGMIPGFGDVVDLFATILWTKVLGPVGLTEALELIPGMDLLPVNIVMGMIADARSGHAHAAGEALIG